MSTRYCVSYNIDYLLRTNEQDLLTAVNGTCSDGTPATPVEIRAWLRHLREAGREQLVIGECDNFDDRGFCKGHWMGETAK